MLQFLANYLICTLVEVMLNVSDITTAFSFSNLPFSGVLKVGLKVNLWMYLVQTLRVICSTLAHAQLLICDFWLE